MDYKKLWQIFIGFMWFHVSVVYAT